MPAHFVARIFLPGLEVSRRRLFDSPFIFASMPGGSWRVASEENDQVVAAARSWPKRSTIPLFAPPALPKSDFVEVW